MRKVILSLTTALAVAALAVPTIASAKNSGGRNSGVSQGSGGAKFSASTNKGQNFASVSKKSGHHHHHHHGGGGWWVPYAAFGGIGAYAAYDQCWDTILTPNGYRRVYVCGPNAYPYF